MYLLYLLSVIYNLYVDVVTIVLLQCIYDTPASAAGLKK